MTKPITPHKRNSYLASLLAALWAGTAAHAATYTVTSTANSGAGTLRQAMLDANANGGLDTINFNIAGGGVKSLVPTSLLPSLTSPVIIDGTTQPGYVSTPMIVVNGASVTGNGIQFEVGASGSTIKGLAVNGFT